MALSNLADADDLAARGITPADDTARGALLAAASAGIREAAGCSITSTTGTVGFFMGPTQNLILPGYGVSDVSAVTIDDTAVTDYKRVGNRMFRLCGWGYNRVDPTVVEVTYTQGLATAPADIVDLCCSLVAAGVASMQDGYDPHHGLSSERIDDYQRVFLRGDDTTVSPMELPRGTRDMLAQRFGNGSAVTTAVS